MPALYPSASVVIPTYNRLSELQLVLDCLCQQEVPDTQPPEIVVVDDGSGDGTAAWLRSQRRVPRLVLIAQENAGPAAARNRGVEAASGEVVLFLGDDTVPQPGWLLGHLEEHRIHGQPGPLAVLGYTSFPNFEDSPFLRWINEFGAQFGYLLISEPRQVPFNFFYTSNISLPRRLLLDLGGFREDFPAAAWEDIEFSYRAVAAGLEMAYQPRARTVHRHRIRPGTFRRRQRTSGQSAAIFARLHPELGQFLGLTLASPTGPFSALRQRLLLAAVNLGERLPGLVPPGIYTRFLDHAYQQGLAEGLQRQGRR